MLPLRNAARTVLCALAVVGAGAAVARAGVGLILNEYNAVADNKYLDGGQYSDAVAPIKEDTYFKSVAGMPDGRVEGNGGNWLELVVVQDHLDIRGWQLRWAETDAGDTDGTDLWYGNAGVEQGVLTFSPAAPVWADLRRGTILTISEKHTIGVDTDWDGADRNFTDGVDPGEVDVTLDLTTDTSYAPTFGNPQPTDDWWIHVSTRWEEAQHTGDDRLVAAVTNVDGDGAGDFSIGDSDWQMTIADAGGTVTCGPVGEDLGGWGGGGVNDKEAGRLEAHPTQAVGNPDYDDATSTTFGQPNEWGGTYQNFDILRTPEPATVALLLAGGAAAAFRRRR